MKKRSAAVLICCVISFAVAAWSHFAMAGNPPLVGPRGTSINNTEIDPAPATAGGNPGINYSTGFEPGEGYPLGYISNAGGTPAGCGGVSFPCWAHFAGSDASLTTPSISDANPASGLQHLRLIHDPTTRTNQIGFGLGVDARYPRSQDLAPRPSAPNTLSVDIAISNPGGMSFRVQPQSPSQGIPSTSVLFQYTGEIQIFWGACEGGIQPTGHYWDTTGAYQNLTISLDPCVPNDEAYDGFGVVHFYYGGDLIYTGCPWGTSLEHLIIFGDNYPGSFMDVDNLVMTSLDECPHVCGNGVVETPFEQCEPSDDSNCPGRCIASGQPGECTCTPICTEADPCPVFNGENGPFLTSSGYYIYSGNAPFVSFDACGSDFDGALTLGTTEGFIVQNIDCTSWASGDSSAPCYRVDEEPDPCACIANPGKPILIRLQGSHTPYVSSILNIRKKSVCAGASVGACCDTNGPDQGCTDNVTQAECTGPDKIWTDQGKCADQECSCIPDCTGATCGSDGCGGSCGGSCDDGNPCNGVETCNAERTCDPGQPLNCDDHNACNGIETCNPSSGCVAGAPVNCDDGLDCTVDACNEPNGSCSHNDADCAIPTVSEWGLVVLAILLLVGAKVRFARAPHWRERKG